MSRYRTPLSSGLLFAIAISLSLRVAAYDATPVTCASQPPLRAGATDYIVSLDDANQHILHVSILLREFVGRSTLAMPVWNALYQVRNFAANIENVRAQDATGAPATIVKTVTSEWEITAPAGCVLVSYDIHLDTPGPFASQVNAEHAFLNLAMVLMYSPELRSRPATVRFRYVPELWKIRDLHLCRRYATPEGAHSQATEDANQLAVGGQIYEIACEAANYDELVDSPVEMSKLQEFSFQQDAATYHVVVHGDPADYDRKKLEDTLKKITHAAVDWMQDRPYDEYTFLYHFPRGPAGGGMEHAYGTAIDVSASQVNKSMTAVADVTAHEFFHLWNVKRIRPQSLEPINYQQENDTRALWFAEGVTSTVGDLLRVRAGLLDESTYLSGIGTLITELERRPAYRWQSAEESSLEAWFEGNAFYRSPERSVSYYDKGDLLGTLLDLRIRALTNGSKSLRDVFHWMNKNYALQHRFYPDSAGVQRAAEAITGETFADFFRDYVAGTKPIPYNEFFTFVGLELRQVPLPVAAPGFTTTANIGGQPEVIGVGSGSDAQRAGLAVGDRILECNRKPATGRLTEELAAMKPGATVKVRVSNAHGQRTLKFKLGSRQEQTYVLQDLQNLTPEQRAHRTAWTHGDDGPGGTH